MNPAYVMALAAVAVVACLYAVSGEEVYGHGTHNVQLNGDSYYFIKHYTSHDACMNDLSLTSSRACSSWAAHPNVWYKSYWRDTLPTVTCDQAKYSSAMVTEYRNGVNRTQVYTCFNHDGNIGKQDIRIVRTPYNAEGAYAPASWDVQGPPPTVKVLGQYDVPIWFAASTPQKLAQIDSLYDGAKWVKFEDGMVIPSDGFKFRGHTKGMGSVHITLQGTQVGGTNLGSDGTFIKGWHHGALPDGVYDIEVRETAGSAIVWYTTVFVGEDTLQEMKRTVWNQPGASEPEPPTNSTSNQQQDPPQQDPPQQDPPQQDPPQQDPPQQDPPQQDGEQPAKSVNVTLSWSGKNWVPFTDGMAIYTEVPKFRGETENMDSIHITINGTKVGGSNVNDQGKFWKAWKHDPLALGTYTLEVRETPDSDIVYSATITIADNGIW